MARPKQHKSLDCSGTVQAVFVRRGAEGRQIAIGSICNGCETFVREDSEMSLDEAVSIARITAEAVGRDLIDINQQITAFEIAGNAQGENSLPGSIAYFQRRWFGTSLSLSLRRHLEEDARAISLRALLGLIAEHIDAFTIENVGAHYGGAATSTFPQLAWSRLSDSTGKRINPEIVASDRATLERMARRLKRSTSAYIHGSDADLRDSLSILSHLSQSFAALDDIANKYCGLVSGVFRHDIIAQSLEANATLEPPRSELNPAPYRLGEPGVPFDALPYNRTVENVKPYISLHAAFDGTDLRLGLANIGVGPARRLRIFVPIYGGQALEEMIPQNETREIRLKVRDEIMKSGIQYVIEFEDLNGYLYRQYSWVQGSWRSSETGIPYLVKDRIVS